MTRFLVIANPTAGRGACAKAIPHVQRCLESLGADFTLLHTKERWHGRDLAREGAADFDVVVAMGGDGTANEVINGLVSAQEEGIGSAALGVIGAGRGNDFADTLNIPIEREEACRLLLVGDPQPIDIGRVAGGVVPEGRYFGNCVGVGFDAIATIEAAKLPRWGGFFSFLIAVLRTIVLYNQGPVATVAYDNKTLTQRSLMISVMNGRRLGGGFIMAPDAQPGDGLFNLCLARQVSRRRVLTLLPHFLRGSQASQDEIITALAANIRIVTEDGVLPAHTDGEIISEEGTWLDIGLLPARLEAICGPLERR